MRRTIGTMPALPTLCDGDCYPASLALMPRPPLGMKQIQRIHPREKSYSKEVTYLENNFAKNGGKQQLNEEQRLRLFRDRYSKIHEKKCQLLSWPCCIGEEGDGYCGGEDKRICPSWWDF